VKSEIEKEWGKNKPRKFICPRCGHVVVTIGVEVWCKGKAPNYHGAAVPCKEVDYDDNRSTQDSDYQQ